MKSLYVLLTLTVLLLLASNGILAPLPAVQAAAEPAHLQGDVIEDVDYFVTFMPLMMNASANPANNQDDLGELIASVTNGNPAQVVGGYIPAVLAARVIQQPVDQPGWVSPEAGTLTEYHPASQLGNLGLLAPTETAQALFDQMAAGQNLTIIQGDGSLREYQISVIMTFQALDPANPNSDYLILPVGVRIPYDELLNCVYGGSDHVVFETTIHQPDVPNWGKLFVAAFPAALDENARQAQVQTLLDSFQN